jgi:hypothetical protein
VRSEGVCAADLEFFKRMDIVILFAQFLSLAIGVPLTTTHSCIQNSKRGALDHFELLEDFLIFRESCLVESVIIISEDSGESCVTFGQSYVERNWLEEDECRKSGRRFA